MDIDQRYEMFHAIDSFYPLAWARIYRKVGTLPELIGELIYLYMDLSIEVSYLPKDKPHTPEGSIGVEIRHKDVPNVYHVLYPIKEEQK